MIVNLVLEGHLEEPVAHKLVTYCGHDVGTVHGRQGFGYIKKKAHKFHTMTTYGSGVLVLTDFMDTGYPCVLDALNAYLYTHIPAPDKHFLMRFSVAELESWLLADRAGIAQFLGVNMNKIPAFPDGEADPKRTLVNIARRSKRSAIKYNIVPPPWHGGAVAPGYLGFMQEFVRTQWDIDSARKNSPSLDRCIVRLQELQ